MITLEQLARLMMEKNASDAHLIPGLPPVLRIEGELLKSEMDRLTAAEVRQLLALVMDETESEILEQQKFFTHTFGLSNLGRFRLSSAVVQGNWSGVLRMIPQQPMSFESMGMPEVIREIIQARSGLILVASPKGGGKTTTANAIVDWYNRNKCKHVIAIENPMEFIHTSKQCLIHQLEITITPDSRQSIGAMLGRMDADAVVLHQMDTPASVEMALALCESGHLVLGTLAGADTQSVLKTLTSAFGLDRVDSIRKALAKHLQGMLAQQLLPRGYSTGRALACEVLVPTQEVRGLIRVGDLDILAEILKNGGDYGMQSMNQSLVELYEKQLVTYNEIFARTTDARDLQTLVKGNEA